MKCEEKTAISMELYLPQENQWKQGLKAQVLMFFHVFSMSEAVLSLREIALESPGHFVKNILDRTFKLVDGGVLRNSDTMMAGAYYMSL